MLRLIINKLNYFLNALIYNSGGITYIKKLANMLPFILIMISIFLIQTAIKKVITIKKILKIKLGTVSSIDFLN